MRAKEFITEARIKPTGNDSAQAWIDYFLTSDHPSLKGQDPETLKRMALAARSKAVHNPPKPKTTFKPSKPNTNARYWWQEKDESIGEGWDEAEELKIDLDDGWIGVENTPEGVLIYGSDIQLPDDKVWIEFVYNLTTDKPVYSKGHHGYNGDYDWYDEDETNLIQDVIHDVKRKYGTTWDEISDELHGGLEVEEETVFEKRKRKNKKRRWAAYGPGPYGGYGFFAGYSGDGGVSGGEGGDAGAGESIEQEGWKDWVAGAAMGAAALGGAGNADAAVKKDINKPSIQHVVKKKEVKPIAPPAASKKELAKSVTNNPHEVYLKKAAEKAGIKGQELIAFLSQCAHETMDFKHMKEIGGKLDFKKYDPKFAPRKAKMLGNTKPGDGAKYKGRGYIQITGKYNYEQAGKALGLDLVNHPELVEKPDVAAKVAVWYWKTRVANKIDSFKDTTAVTKGINPGLKHLDQRKDKMKSFQVAMR